MDRYLARVSASTALDQSLRSMRRAITWLEEFDAFDLSAKLDEIFFDAIQLRREVLELPRDSGVPPALEEQPEDIPF